LHELCWPFGEVRNLTFKHTLLFQQEVGSHGVLSVVNHYKTVIAVTFSAALFLYSQHTLIAVTVNDNNFNKDGCLLGCSAM
jgi:hypothetical protein